MLIPVIHGILLCQLQYRESNFIAAAFFYSRLSQLQDYSNFQNKIGSFGGGGSSSHYRIFSMRSGDLYYVSIPLPQVKESKSFLTLPGVNTDRESQNLYSDNRGRKQTTLWKFRGRRKDHMFDQDDLRCKFSRGPLCLDNLDRFLL